MDEEIASSMENSGAVLFESDKQFITRSKEENQGFQFDFELLGFATLTPDFVPKPSTPRVSDGLSACFKKWNMVGPLPPVG